MLLSRTRRTLCAIASVCAFCACHRAHDSSALSVTPPDGTFENSDGATLTANGTRLYYESAGSGPTVVLIHGGNLDSRMWDPQFVALSRKYRVIRYDARGFGRSGAQVDSFQAHDDLFALLKALGVQHMSLVGLSMGGRIAIDFTLAHPSMVDRLVLAAPGLSGWQGSAGDTSWVPEARLARSRGDSLGVTRAWLKSDLMKAAMENSAVAGRLQELAGANATYWMERGRHGDLERAASPPALHRTAMLRVPTLLIIGTRDAPEILRIADTLTSTVPHLRRVTLTGVGHMVNMEQPTRFTDVVRDFLRP